MTLIETTIRLQFQDPIPTDCHSQMRLQRSEPPGDEGAPRSHAIAAYVGGAKM